MAWLHKKIVVCCGSRTPIGHISRSLSSTSPEDLMQIAVENTLRKAKLPKEAVDGLIVGWVGQSFTAPNIARVTALRAELPETVQAVTVQNNCVSSIESASSAVRFLQMGEGDLYICGGTESMSNIPYTILGSRASKSLRNLETLKSKWGEIWQDGEATVVDSIEQGLTDPVKKINMAGTAEVCAQMYGITREEQDAYAAESLKRCLGGWNRGFYAGHVVPVSKNGAVVLEKDEYPFLREDLAAKPQKFAKAPALFDNSAYSMKRFYEDYGHYITGVRYQEGKSKGTVTLFNSCARSDGAAAVIVATEEKAKALGLEIFAEIKSWGFYGNNPAHMGISPALAAPVALERAGITFDQLDQIELHEPFAATVLSIFKIAEEKFGHRWQAKWKDGALNPNGGSIPMGHPLGATGARLLLNLVYALKSNPKGRYGMLAACAGGGMGGAMVIEKKS
ncbi:MAG: thiolase family protein [Elusimicrobia bacterium]|nr:thiolase family protein [Elusimicrobiota bacterium]